MTLCLGISGRVVAGFVLLWSGFLGTLDKPETALCPRNISLFAVVLGGAFVQFAI
jgi:hypothetical protein